MCQHPIARCRRRIVAAVAAAGIMAAGPTSSAGVTPAQSASGAAGHARFVDEHGPVLRTEQLYLIYWGTAWEPQAAPIPTSTQVTDATRILLASAYMSGLAEYRGIGQGRLRGSAIITSSDPPARFTDDQVARFIDGQLTAGAIPGPDIGNQTLYGVVMPPGIAPDSPGQGEHNYYPRSNQPIHYAWFANTGDLRQITWIVSHELVEAATDPDGDAFLGVPGACGGRPGWCEIADVCPSSSLLDGITVEPYWSNLAGQCVVPASTGPAPRSVLDSSRGFVGGGTSRGARDDHVHGRRRVDRAAYHAR